MDPRIIKKKLEIIADRQVAETWPVRDLQVRQADYSAPGRYTYDGDWAALKDGYTWWPAGKTVFLRGTIDLPQDDPESSCSLSVDCEGLEGLLRIDGKPYAGVDVNHLRIPLPPGGSFGIEMELVSLLRVFCDPSLKGEYACLKRVRGERVRPEVTAAWYDLRFAWQVWEVLPDSRRKQKLHEALEAALLEVDLTLSDDELALSLASARELLARRIAKIETDPETVRLFLAGHTHIDVAWLWPLAETVRKCARTFSTACRLIERYPHFIFNCSQPQLYAYTKEHYPSLYAEIKEHVRQGRWKTTGAMWVETDCNIPSGESLIRQILYGLAFFREEFGTQPTTCWLPDVFGYPGNLPQILTSCGLESFFTTKLHWQSRNAFPHHLFWWQAIDGSRILAHIPLLDRNYNGLLSPRELLSAAESFTQPVVYDEVLLPYGYGDGGGGPNAEMLEYAKRAERFPGLPPCRFGGEQQYFDAVRQSRPDLPCWQGELYLETHRGTYTTQAPIKKSNRRCETLLRDAEILGFMAFLLGSEIDMSSLAPAWRKLLLHQFHDVLPGSSIGRVYEEAREDYACITAAAQSVIRSGLDIVDRTGRGGDLLMLNTLSWKRSDPAVVRLHRQEPLLVITDARGETRPAQKIRDHSDGADYVFVPAGVPALGYASFGIAAPELGFDGRDCSTISASPGRLENGFFIVELDENGEIARLYDKRCSREIIPAGSTANQLQLFQDGPERESAWNVHSTFARRRYAFDNGCKIDLVENGPVRAVLRIERGFRRSRVVQDIMLYDGVPRIDFATRVQWHQRQVLLKAAFPVDVLSHQAAFEIQFGAAYRATHSNTSWEQEQFEVPAHRWADLSESDYGVSLLNDAKYGYDVKNNVLRISLLRGTEYPDPEADKGHHSFTYSLLPHEGGWAAGGTVQRARELNVPLLGLAASEGPGSVPVSRSLLQTDGPSVLETIKPAEDGNGWIARLYEPFGSRGPVRLTVSRPPKEVTECNSIEENGRGVTLQDSSFSFPIRPFQIRTFRIVF